MGSNSVWPFGQSVLPAGKSQDDITNAWKLAQLQMEAANYRMQADQARMLYGYGGDQLYAWPNHIQALLNKYQDIQPTVDLVTTDRVPLLCEVLATYRDNK